MMFQRLCFAWMILSLPLSSRSEPDLSPLQRPSRPMREAAQQHYASGTRFFEEASGTPLSSSSSLVFNFPANATYFTIFLGRTRRPGGLGKRWTMRSGIWPHVVGVKTRSGLRSAWAS